MTFTKQINEASYTNHMSICVQIACLTVYDICHLTGIHKNNTNCLVTEQIFSDRISFHFSSNCVMLLPLSTHN